MIISLGSTILRGLTGSSYHVLWKTNQMARAADDGPLDTVTFDPNSTQPAYAVDYPSSTVSIFGEWERLPIGGVFLPPGNYNCEIVLAEESFHGSGGTYSGNWAGALEGNISFTIEQMPTPTVPSIPMGPIAAFASMTISLGIIGVISRRRRAMRSEI